MDSVAGDRQPKPDWAARAFRISTVQAAVLVLVGLATSWFATYALGGAAHVAPHWFYIPILLGGSRFGIPGGLATAVAAGVLSGPLMPADVDRAISQPLTDWLSRSVFFVVIGLIMSLIITRLRTALGRELDLAKAERELARHKEAVIQTVSHEFRTPLAIIQGSVEAVARAAITDEVRPFVESLEHAARRLDDLVKVVLAASETLIQPGRRREQRIDVRSLCESILTDIDANASSRTRIVCDEGAEAVISDPDLVTIVLREAIDNALKFSPPTTAAVIEARRTADGIEICVRDSGPGMTDGDRRRAFEPFTQEDESQTRHGQGIGLGLFAARKTVELLGGRIELRNATEGGTVAVITLPQRRRGEAGPLRLEEHFA